LGVLSPFHNALRFHLFAEGLGGLTTARDSAPLPGDCKPDLEPDLEPACVPASTAGTQSGTKSTDLPWQQVCHWTISHGYGFDTGSGKAANHLVQATSSLRPWLVMAMLGELRLPLVNATSRKPWISNKLLLARFLLNYRETLPDRGPKGLWPGSVIYANWILD
jgi:hypothetical protein